jgi:phosphodiesterase/alkaline phosphatase D-like protein
LLTYNLPVAGKVEVNVYNQYGQLVKQLVNERQQAGSHQVEITNADLKSMGTYYYQILLQGEARSFIGQSTLIVIN